MAARRVRWECPAGIHPAVLGSTRPRKNATVRYCLPCSEAGGELVERVAPALERQRAAKTAVAHKRNERRSEKARAAKRSRSVLEVREVDGTRGELDIRRTLEKMIRLPVLRDLAERYCPYAHLRAPEVTLRRSRTQGYSGHAHYYTWGFVVTASADPSRESFEELLLHELVHLLTPGANHNQRYRSLLTMAAREYWPGLKVRADDAKTAYALDAVIIKEVKAGKRGKHGQAAE